MFDLQQRLLVKNNFLKAAFTIIYTGSHMHITFTAD